MLDLFPSREAGPFGRRLKRERGARIPVTLVTGFLGAGKTTLIRRFLASPEGQGTAVIVNEFGAVGIDDALVREAAEQTILLGNGCVCCITRTDLQLALRQLVIDRERGLVPSFARVVIETSGVADPGPILQTFSTDRALGGEFHIDVMLAVVDAVNGEATLKNAAEARKQVILADRLVISKSDLAGAAGLEALSQNLQKLNSRAGIDVAVGGALDPDRFIAPATAERSGFIAEAEHSDGISSFVLERQQPVEWPAFSRAMETLDRAARCRASAGQGYSQCHRLPRSSGRAICPASRAPAGGTAILAGPKPRQPRCFHHAEYSGGPDPGFVCRRGEAGERHYLGGLRRSGCVESFCSTSMAGIHCVQILFPIHLLCA